MVLDMINEAHNDASLRKKYMEKMEKKGEMAG